MIGEWDIRVEWQFLSERHYILEGGRLYPGWGVAYLDHYRAVAVCYPIPINLIVRAWRWVYQRLTWPKWIPYKDNVKFTCHYCGADLNRRKDDA